MRPLAILTQRIAAEQLASNIVLRVRWIPSESNHADEPSRRFQSECSDVIGCINTEKRSISWQKCFKQNQFTNQYPKELPLEENLLHLR